MTAKIKGSSIFGPSVWKVLGERMLPVEWGPGFVMLPKSWIDGCFIQKQNDEFFEVPTDLNSIEFLLYLGFNEDVACIMFDKWKCRAEVKHWLADEALIWIKNRSKILDAAIDSDDSDDALRQMGLSRGILNSEHVEPFDVQRTVSSYAEDAVNITFQSLRQLNKLFETKLAVEVQNIWEGSQELKCSDPVLYKSLCSLLDADGAVPSDTLLEF